MQIPNITVNLLSEQPLTISSQHTCSNRLVPVAGDNEFTVSGRCLGCGDWEEFSMSINVLNKEVIVLRTLSQSSGNHSETH